MRLLFLFILITNTWAFAPQTTPQEEAITRANQQVQQMLAGKLLRTGDLIFQTSPSGQSMAIQLATSSKYSHCGLIVIENGKYFVYEAVQPVKKTPLAQWIARGIGGHFVVKRYGSADLGVKQSQKVIRQAKAFLGKNYDYAFAWSDDKIYCSELIWKVYDRALGIRLAPLQKLQEFNLKDPRVKAKLIERYGKNIPLNEKVISPAALFESRDLRLIFEE